MRAMTTMKAIGRASEFMLNEQHSLALESNEPKLKFERRQFTCLWDVANHKGELSKPLCHEVYVYHDRGYLGPV